MIVNPYSSYAIAKPNPFAIASRLKDALRDSLMMTPVQATCPLSVELRGKALTRTSWAEMLNQNCFAITIAESCYYAVPFTTAV